MSIKTLEQQRAFYCLKCIQRLKLAKEGNFFDLQNPNSQYNLIPDEIDKIIEYSYFDGIKKELHKKLVEDLVEYISKEDILKEDILKNLPSNLKNSKDQIKDKIKKYLENSDDTKNNEIKQKLNNSYKKYIKESKESEVKQKLNLLDNYLSDYSSHAKRFPQMIISNGLIPTLAFYKSKGKAKGQIYSDICEMLEVLEFKLYKDFKDKNKDKNKGNVLLEFLINSDSNTLRLATMEALALANWLKRIVEIELKEKE
jgi:CRISPR-associated protein Cmr5